MFTFNDNYFKNTVFKFESIKDEIKRRMNKSLKTLYGDNINYVIKNRVNEELKLIDENNYYAKLLITSLIIDKIRHDNKYTFFRGDLGNLLLARLLNITEVNPLFKHYRCGCGYHSFIMDNNICPYCNKRMITDGFNLDYKMLVNTDGCFSTSFEINIPNDYQKTLIEYIYNVFGKYNVFRIIDSIKNIHPYKIIIIPDGHDISINTNYLSIEDVRINNMYSINIIGNKLCDELTNSINNNKDINIDDSLKLAFEDRKVLLDLSCYDNDKLIIDYLSNKILTRDQLERVLIDNGLDESTSAKYMVKYGKYLYKYKNEINELISYIPLEYNNYLKNNDYLFPEAHLVSYLLVYLKLFLLKNKK